MNPWPIIEVEVYGYAPEIFTGATRAKATWRAYSAFREHWSCDFGDWIARTQVRLISDPSRLERLNEAYENVEAQYGVRPRIGEIRTLKNEGPNSGRKVLVIYPGRHTSMIHCAYLGESCPMLVHPLNAVRSAAA